MARESVFPKELVTRLILHKAPERDIDLKKYDVFCMGHVVDNLPEVDNWRVPAVPSKNPATCKHYLTVIVSKNADGVIQMDFSEI